MEIHLNQRPIRRASQEPYWPSVSQETRRLAPFGKMKEASFNANIHQA